MLVFEFSRKGRRSLTGQMAKGWEIIVFLAIALVMAETSGAILFLTIPLFVIGVWLIQSNQGPIAKILISAPAQFLGRISYSIYMVHTLIIVIIIIVSKRVFGVSASDNPVLTFPLIVVNPWLGDVLVVGLIVTVVATASLTYFLVEEPGRLLGRHYFRRIAG